MQNHPIIRALTLIPLGLLAGCSGVGTQDNVATTSQGLSVQVTLPVFLGGQTQLTQFTGSDKPSILHPTGMLAPESVPAPGSGSGGIIREAPVTPPASVDISSWAATPGNQGEYGSCSSWASGYTSLGWWVNKTGLGGNPFNPMFLYAQLVPGCNEGSTLEAPMAMLKSEGNDTLSEFPATDCTVASSAQKSAAAPYKITNYQQYDLSGGVEAEIKAVLAAGTPITLGILVYSEFMNATSTNYLVGPPSSTSELYGGHAVTALKYDDNGVWIENSWGPDWGKAGWAELSWDFVNGSTSNGSNVDDAVGILGLVNAPTPPPSTPDAGTVTDAGGSTDAGSTDAEVADAAPPPPPPPGEGPTVTFTSPTNGVILPTFTNQTVTALASDTGATISSAALTIVGPYGTSTRAMSSSNGTTWSVGVEFGEADSRALSVTVTDSNGKTATASETVDVESSSGGPSVSFSSPTSGATLPAYSAQTITATATDTGATISSATLTVVGPYGTITQAMSSSDGAHYSIGVEFGMADSRSLTVNVTDSKGQTASYTETIQIQ